MVKLTTTKLLGHLFQQKLAFIVDKALIGKMTKHWVPIKDIV